MAEGLAGLLRDRTRPPGKAPVADDRASAIVAMAKAVGLAVSTVRKIWRIHGLAPHRWRSFKLSNDPAFAEKLHEVVGLYVAPPAHAVVLSIDESERVRATGSSGRKRTQIQALDRTQPGLPLKKGRGATSYWKHASGLMTHDYKRNGTTTLFAALNVLDGTVTGRNMQRHQRSSASSTRSIATSRWARRFMSSSTTTPPTNTPRSARGSPAIRAGPSTSRPLPVPG